MRPLIIRIPINYKSALHTPTEIYLPPLLQEQGFTAALLLALKWSLVQKYTIRGCYIGFIKVAEKISAYSIFQCRNNIALTTLHPYSVTAISRKPDLIENTTEFNSVIKVKLYYTRACKIMGGQIYFNDIYDNGKYSPQILQLKYCNKYSNTHSAVPLFLEQLGGGGGGSRQIQQQHWTMQESC